MSLQQELGLKNSIKLLNHEALLNIYYTASQLKKKADEFFRPFELTDVQFNLLMLLEHQSSDDGGLSQAQLSDMMLVNRANITSLIDRMEKSDLVIRTENADDRRFNIIKLTEKGKKLLSKVEPLYVSQMEKIMSSLQDAQLKQLIDTLETIRSELKK
jgi:MarR family 2-MHQ and catechol resistance regulon transcriptional repressor